MNISCKFPKAAAAVAGMIMMSMPAMAVDFDVEEVVVDGFMYGIVGTEAPYKAYVVEYYDWDEFESAYKGELIVPETVEFEPGKVATVVGVDDNAFYSSEATMVTLPNTVETIGKQAFGLCWQLTCVKLGSSVTEIKSKAFSPDAKLTTMYIDAVTPPAIAADALMNDPASMTLYVPEGSVDLYKAAETWSTIGNITTATDVVTVTEIVVSPDNATIAEMGSVQLTATVYPAEAQQKVSWTSSDKSIAMVSATGNVFGMKSGVCVITASATDGSGVSGQCVITVGTGTSLQVNMPFVSGFTGEVFKLSAEVAPSDAMVFWSISDEAIASLDADDKEATVTLLAPGNTTITVNATNGLSTEIEVTVKENITLTGIEVSPATIECEVGDRISLWEFTINPVPENVSAFNPDFRIEDPTIVDYDPEDYDMETFECLAPGTTRFVWSQDGIEGYCTIVVGSTDTIGTITASDTYTVVTIDGIVIMKNVDKATLATLPAGFYIINGKKFIKPM